MQRCWKGQIYWKEPLGITEDWFLVENEPSTRSGRWLKSKLAGREDKKNLESKLKGAQGRE